MLFNKLMVGWMLLCAVGGIINGFRTCRRPLGWSDCIESMLIGAFLGMLVGATSLLFVIAVDFLLS